MMIYRTVEYVDLNVSQPSIGYFHVSAINGKCTKGLNKLMVTCIENLPIQARWNKVEECQAIG